MDDNLKHIQDNLQGEWSVKGNKSLAHIPQASKCTEILLWMSPEPYIQHHEQTKQDVLSGTGQWLLSDPVFEMWKKESASSILWLHGIPGSGKSKLV